MTNYQTELIDSFIPTLENQKLPILAVRLGSKVLVLAGAAFNWPPAAAQPLESGPVCVCATATNQPPFPECTIGIVVVISTFTLLFNKDYIHNMDLIIIGREFEAFNTMFNVALKAGIFMRLLPQWNARYFPSLFFVQPFLSSTFGFQNKLASLEDP